jgi:hypothetical protein
VLFRSGLEERKLSHSSWQKINQLWGFAGIKKYQKWEQSPSFVI